MLLDNMTVLSTPFFDDMPRAFLLDNDNLSDSTALFGPYAQIIWNFADKHQMQLAWNRDLIEINSEILQRIDCGEYNLSMNGATIVKPIPPNVQFSYPLYWTKSCIMIPLEDELPKYWYIIWPFGRYIYMCILFGIIYVAILMKYVEYPTNEHRPTRSITRNILYSSAILMYGSNMNVRLKNAQVRVLIFYALLFVLGFILAAYHSPYLTGYNMKPIFMPPINTIEGLTEANIKLNRSYAYVITEYQWKFFNRQQRVLIQPYFHLSNICFGTVFKAIPVQRDAVWYDALNLFILITQESGLWEQWEERAFFAAVSAKYAEIFTDTYPLEALNLRYFLIAWIVLGSGLLLSCFAFALEYYSKKRNSVKEETSYNRFLYT
ncbi:PREDICTED: uncharacterized protein LOC108375901 [Rhagoletis zephyria]|uniref:uncharacterized protein LOC108375901 n=1 Tax=Rhagoletis zephyria TaxID=28612 RepID=UPI0008117916|nr:PREDICTED: uncharacterized protein LOC108375901 [Rhagoletis zephyria]